ncbi:hypothetical protein BJ875DRAFT_441767 [Amylocarpus encephaloides]|uniref:Uncharacterized protein n=1 Tax=Amylocarpus encephaloides TaxID=45428 RepID=A0A9P7YHU7_9HELO|nr:hypothetical protein BJ875DRAFT_441767 [Amylocarpus encephaloides]
MSSSTIANNEHLDDSLAVASVAKLSLGDNEPSPKAIEAPRETNGLATTDSTSIRTNSIEKGSDPHEEVDPLLSAEQNVVLADELWVKGAQKFIVAGGRFHEAVENLRENVEKFIKYADTDSQVDLNASALKLMAAQMELDNSTETLDPLGEAWIGAMVEFRNSGGDPCPGVDLDSHEATGEYVRSRFDSIQRAIYLEHQMILRREMDAIIDGILEKKSSESKGFEGSVSESGHDQSAKPLSSGLMNLEAIPEDAAAVKSKDNKE